MRRDYALALALFALTMGAYLATLCPLVYIEGSGELIGATWWLGTPHPTGYPLYVLVARLLAVSMPTASPAAAINAATALLSSLAAPALYLLLRQRRLTRAAAGSAALALVGGRTYWSQAVVAEVYGLFVLLAILVLACCLQARDRGPMQPRWMLLSGYLGGMAATCHLQAVLLLPPAFCVALWRGRQELSRAPGNLFRLLVGGAGGASLILYLLVRNDLGAGFHWGGLHDGGALWDHVTGALYRPSFVLLPPVVLVAGLARLGAQLVSEWPSFLLPTVFWGGVLVWRQDRSLAIAVLGAAALNLIVGLGYHRDPEGIHVFFLLLLTCCCILMGVGVDDLGRRLRRRLPVTVVNCLIVAGGFAVLGVNFREVDRSSVILPDAYGRWLLAELPQDAVLLTDGDDASFIIDYLHRIEGVRPDIEVFNRMGRGADLAPPAASEAVKAGLRRRREAALLTTGRPVHFLVPRAMPSKEFDFSPWGLSYRATRKGEEFAQAPVRSPVTLLANLETVHDPWLDKLKANCWYMEAEALRSQGDAAAAIEAYLRAASLAPRSQSLHYNISLILLRMKELETAGMIAKKAIDIDRVRRGPYELAVLILTRLGQHEEAKMVHKRALKWARIP